MERLEHSMTMTQTSPFEAALDVIDRLPPDDQEAIIEIVRKRMTERRRREIADNAQATLQAFREGRASYGTVDDLRRELEA
jgi:TRAP-type C4-dicarboxylate transport system substrate-binding protein